MIRRLSLPIASEDALEGVAAAAHILGRPAGPPTFQLVRETYFDTPDGTLRDNRFVLRLRTEIAGREVVALTVVEEAVSLQGVIEEHTVEAPVVGGGLYSTLGGNSEVATRVKEIVDPAALRPQLALDIDREVRELKTRLLGRPVRRVSFDRIVAHTAQASKTFQELSVVELAASREGLDGLADRLRTRHRLESDGLDTYDRIRRAFGGLRLEAPVEVPHDVRVALLVLRAGEIALLPGDEGLLPPTARGSGEDLAAEYLRELVGEGGAGDLELVGFAPARRGGSDLEVWLFESAPDVSGPESFVWIPLAELLERVGGPGLGRPGLVATLLLLVRSEIGVRLLREAPPARGMPRELPFPPRPSGVPAGSAPDDLLDLELSILDFNQRVLELAEDTTVPLLERFKFLSIFSSNLDEFFVVRAGHLKDEQARGRDGDGGALGATDLLDIIQIRVRALVARQYHCLSRDLLPRLERSGVRIRSWKELDAAQREALTATFEGEIFPLLTPLVLAAAPGRPFPRLASLGLSLAAVLRRAGADQTTFGCVSIPDDVPRLVPVPNSQDLVAVEEVVVANAPALFPGSTVQEVHTFRVSRLAHVEIDEDSTGSLLDLVADQVEARPYGPVVRIEVQRNMPRDVQAYLLRELRAERATDTFELGRGEVYEVDGPIDLASFADPSDLELAGERYPALDPARPLAPDVSVFDVLAEGDVLVHHPFDDFATTVGRFLQEAASDPGVVSIKLTLYRTGRDSPVMEALLRAIEAGKDVSVFVELKARFDEESNIEWTHRLREAGAHVIYGLAGFKTHAKTALVIRREAEGIRRYVHIGTGNYNATTARFYTDLGLMSADVDLGADLNDFFNELTGSSGPPQKACRKLLVAPHSLAPTLLDMIEREVEHARRGRVARIQAKLNGLADKEVVRALYDASREGVEIDLVVRSICTLRPGVPGLSEGIRVRSILGRFLEHARIYYFEGGGDGEYYIGSADWRARNLRRRVEVVAPVEDIRARARLRAILDAELESPHAWVLRPDGAYERLGGEGPTSQERFAEGLEVAAPGP